MTGFFEGINPINSQPVEYKNAERLGTDSLDTSSKQVLSIA
jgi:hypothetical protein